MKDTIDLDGDLAELWADYAARLSNRILAIAEALNSWQNGERNPETFLVLRRLVHGLAGSSGMFGFPTVSKAARSFQMYLDLVSEQAGPASPEQHAHSASLFATLEQVAANAVQSPDMDE